MIGVVVPAHDEARRIGGCLRSIARAAQAPALAGEAVRVVVVLDRCADASGEIALRHGAITQAIDACNVGLARAVGAHDCLAAGARWLAFTDADTRVSPDWLAAQLSLAEAGHDAVCGTVGVHDWRGHPREVRRLYRTGYTDADGHRHVHGANLGVSAAAYRRSGGFEPLACHEDVALVRALLATGATVAWSARPRVTTSARRSFRAPGGFGALLARMAAELGPQTAAVPGTT